METLAMAAETPMTKHPGIDINNLSYEIFSILENKFLSGFDDPSSFVAGAPPTIPVKFPKPLAAGKVCILSIDADDCILAAVTLTRLEASLSKQCGNPSARIVDFFDIAAGSGSGGVLAAMLFTRGPDGSPLFSASDALRFLSKNRGKLSSAGRKGVFNRSARLFHQMFGESTLRDTIKPVLIPCCDLSTGSPFVFSRTDAIEADAFDFLIRHVCKATCSEKTRAAVRSMDGRRRIDSVGGNVVMRNPTAMAVTHVLNNRVEFPFAAGVDDLLVFSLGSCADENGQPPPAELLKIAGDTAADLVDQAVAMAFRQSRATSYVRIQAQRRGGGRRSAAGEAAEKEVLGQRSIESVLFRGRKLSEKSNGDRLEWVCGELIAEQNRRNGSSVPTVLIKPTFTPRTSSSTNSTAISMTSPSPSPSPSAASL